MIEKYKKLSNGVKASIWFMFCSILQKGITFLTIPIFTRMLTTSQYGEYSLFLSWQEIISIFATLNLNYQVFNNGMVKYKEDKDGYTTAMVGLAFVSSVVTFLFITVMFNSWYDLTGIDYISVCLMFINMFALVVFGLWTVRKRYDFDYKLLTLLTALMAILNPIIGIVFVKLSTNKVLFRILSIAITSIIFASIAFVLLMRKSKKIVKLEYWKYALKLSLPLIPHYISLVILHSSDRIMIGKIINESATAFYSVSYNVAVVMQIIINSINASFIPWVYKRLENKEYSDIKRFSNVLMVFVAVVSALPMFFAPEAVLILGGKEYLDAASIIPVLSTSVFMMFFYSILIIVETYYEKSSYITTGSVFAAIINIILNYVFIQIFGYKAAAYTTLISYMALALFHYIMYRKVCKENNIKEQIFDIKTMTMIATVLFIISLLVIILYKNTIVRYLLILCVITLLIIKRKNMINIIKLLKNKKG